MMRKQIEHPVVNMSIIGFVLMFVAAMWMFFDSDPYGAWLDVVVTGLFFIAIAIPALLWLTCSCLTKYTLVPRSPLRTWPPNSSIRLLDTETKPSVAAATITEAMRRWGER
jgi:hypothetical protein